nr:zinc finger MYM-type protein 1-like [Ipomoea batatas]
MRRSVVGDRIGVCFFGSDRRAACVKRFRDAAATECGSDLGTQLRGRPGSRAFRDGDRESQVVSDLGTATEEGQERGLRGGVAARGDFRISASQSSCSRLETALTHNGHSDINGDELYVELKLRKELYVNEKKRTH